MKLRFDDDDLERVYTEPAFTKGLAPGIVKAFRLRIQTIVSAPDERTFYELRSLRFEKLKGNRNHQYSMRLNDQWRLVLELRGKGTQKVAAIVSIEDYH